MSFADNSTVRTLERLYAQVSSDNPYKILGVSEDCKDNEIKYNYRELANWLDPDNVPHEDLVDYHVELFQKVETAYDQLILRYTARDSNSEPSLRERKPAKTTIVVTDSDSEPPSPPSETRKRRRARRAKDSYLEDFSTLEQAIRAKTISTFSAKNVEDYYFKQEAPVQQVRGTLLPAAESWAEKMLREQRQIEAEIHREAVAQTLWEEEQEWDDEYDEDDYEYEEEACLLDEYEDLSKKEWRRR